MNPILRNSLAVVGGWVLGSILNSAIVMLNGTLIPLPEGADVSTIEKLSESMTLFEPIHFLIPFLSHALGTLVGAYLAARLANGIGLIQAMMVGFLFFLGGIAVNFMLPDSPLWFTLTDLIVAYFPMAFLGYKIAGKRIEN